MAAPLIAAGGVKLLASAAINHAPRLAAFLASADSRGQSVMVEQRPGRESQEASSPVTHTSSIAKWASHIALAGATLAGGQALAATEVGSGVRGGLQRIEEAYRKFMGPKAEDRFGAVMSQSAHSGTRPEISPERMSNEQVALAASIVGVGFENQIDRKKNGGAFDSLVLNQVKEASDIIAPGKAFSEMTLAERQAVTTSAIYGSNGSFMKNLAAQDPSLFKAGADSLANRVLAHTQQSGSAGKFAEQFMTHGRFDAGKFASTVVDASGTHPAQLQGGSRKALDAMIVATSFTKAAGAVVATQGLMEEGKTDAGTMKWASKNMRDVQTSVEGRKDRLRMTDQPGERETPQMGRA